VRGITLLCAAGLVLLLGSAQHAYSQEPKDVPAIRKSQFFCGYCHILTYPRVIKKAHGSWKKGKHKDIACARCHYPPEKYGVKIPEHEKIPKDERAEAKRKTEMEFMKTELEVLSRLTTILNMDETTVVRRSKIDDRSCTTSKCHPTTGKGKKGKYWTEKIKYMEYERDDKSKVAVRFTHEKHYDKKKWTKGDVLHCDTCHTRQTEKKHFEVTKETCFICHFGNKKMNVKLSKCALCHKVPEDPLQKQKQKEEKKEGEKEDPPITHETLEKAKVPCASCHGELIKGTGAVRKETCLDCHDTGKGIMEKAEDLEVMHKEHVAKQNARCFECHEPIEHKEDKDLYKHAVKNCTGCHENTHIYQQKLLAGDASPEVETTPALMHDVKTNCMGCHMKFEHDDRGQKVKRAEAKPCVDCHTKRHKSMLKEWKDKIKEELEAVQEVRQEAEEAIEKAKGKVPDEKLQEAMTGFKKGEETVNVVKFGNGAHNKKYSIMLIDLAFGYFEDIIDNLEEGGEELSGSN
jgi:gas vesicle protein